MNAQLSPFQQTLAHLLDETRTLSSEHLRQFSDLDASDLTAFADAWRNISLNRKLTLLEGLESLAEDDMLVNFEDFAKALLADTEATVRGRAIRLLCECEDTQLIPSLIAILKNDSDAQTRAEAAAVLSVFVDLGELEELSSSALLQVEDALLESVNRDDDVRVQRRALESLGYSSRPEVVELIESAYRRGEAAWRASALFAMSRSADTRWDEDILDSLTSDNLNVREAAVEAAGELSVKDAVPVLLRILEEDGDDEISGAVVWALSQIGGDDARIYIQTLRDQAEDDDQIEFLEEALENLDFTDDLDRFDLLNYEPDFELDEEQDDDNGPYLN